MKKLVVVTLLLAFVSLVFSQQAKEKSALQSMVDTELAFARMAKEQATRPAFMAFIAEDGILFRPRAVKGKQWMIDHPVPPSDKKPLLSWYPAIAGIAAAGADARRSMGRAGRRIVEEGFAVEVEASRLSALFQSSQTRAAQLRAAR